MHSARQASARMVIEVLSHRRVAGGLAAGEGSGAGGRTGMRRTTARSASRDTRRRPRKAGQHNEETRVLQVSQERKCDPPVSDTLGHYEGFK